MKPSLIIKCHQFASLCVLFVLVIYSLSIYCACIGKMLACYLLGAWGILSVLAALVASWGAVVLHGRNKRRQRAEGNAVMHLDPV